MVEIHITNHAKQKIKERVTKFNLINTVYQAFQSIKKLYQNGS